MKREGRQHGMVRTYPIMPSPMNPGPNSASAAVDDSPPPPTAGVFTKVSRKPTNHSKFTGKCRVPRCNECHIHPCGKSKDKAKGTHKSRAGSHDVATGHLMWRLADRQHVSDSDGLSSATEISGYLVASNEYNDDDIW
ncbi:unnamed protein product [Linum trigynum]|uniref:Uncharacterized protein n=1 Tax=Linum trigynum TaxID=586398 RepID=A0AAV2EJ12_9ROSI